MIIRDYAEHLCGEISQFEDKDADNARRVVDEARRILLDSGLGRAIGAVFVGHIEYWAAWSQRDDFVEWVHFPCGDIRAASQVVDDSTWSRDKICFVYRSRNYEIDLLTNRLQLG